MQKRIAVVGIVIEGDKSVSVEVQKVLTRFADIIIGRMGLPDRESGVSVISLIVKGEVEKLSALTGQLGKLDRVTVKSAMTGANIESN